MEERISIKGSRDGLRLILHPDAPWGDVMRALHQQLGKGTAFFQGARLLIDIGERATSDIELEELLAAMSGYSLEPAALVSSVVAAEAPPAAAPAAAEAPPAEEARPPAPRQPEPSRDRPLPVDGHEGLFIWRTVRSGQEVRHAGHVVVVGDVNAGSEIVAGGSVLIWGRLRGRVHAGATGDAQAVVCALELSPSLLRIADQLARTPDNYRPTRPEQAAIEAGQIVVVPWDAPRR
ncbi:MAG TPA: septum site-determining protein MinC [Herpetosiphonaceae bacterium]